jgi:23S rRNA pseudouridine2605 synthase
VRINRYLARSGVTSRRKSEELIVGGRVTVNGKIVTDLGFQINPEEDVVKLDGKVLQLPEFKYYLLNKPAGYTVTKFDKYAERTVFELLPRDDSLFAAGRLDRDTRGLIIITNDGDFGQKLVHPSTKIEKEYLVKTAKPVNKEDLEKLVSGVMLETKIAKANKAELYKDGRITITIEEGRNRIVRKMFAAIGHEVTDLQRIRIGKIHLGDVKEGSWRMLTPKEAEI